MLLYQISDIDYVPKNTQLQLRISTIRGRLADGARCAVVRSDQFDQRSETELRIQLKELLFDDGSLFKVVDEKKSWFTRMEVLDLIYHQFFLSANSLGAPAYNIAVFPTSHSADFSAGSCTYPLCAV